SSKLIALRRERATQQVAAELGIAAGEEVFHLERLRLADGTPMAYETNYIPASLCPDLETYDLERDSLYRILEEEHGIRMQSADEVL
ncbi:UTRA domain-containing protein, partial [Acinetobacter baumannii]